MPTVPKKPNHAFKNGIPTRCLHRIQHYLLMQALRDAKEGRVIPLRRENIFFLYYKHFNVTKKLKGKALCLLKTQYAKKPKNPV